MNLVDYLCWDLHLVELLFFVIVIHQYGYNLSV